MKRLYEKIKNAYDNNSPVDIEELKEYLLYNDKIYRQGNIPELSDYEYDILHEIYKSLTGEMIHAHTNSKAIHEYPSLKGTMEKVYYPSEKEKALDPGAVSSHGTLANWIIIRDDELIENGVISSDERVIGVFPKYDGVSIQLSVNRHSIVTKAITRGDSELGIGEDRTHIFQGIDVEDYVPVSIGTPEQSWGLKIECIMKKSNFMQYNTAYGNSKLVNERTAITSLTNSQTFTKAHLKYLSFIPLLVEYDGELVSYGDYDEFGPIMTLTKSNIDSLPEIIERVKKKVDKLDYQCDGLVFRFYHPNAMRSLGRNENRGTNRFEVAYKFPKPSNYTRIIDIEQDIGLMGKVSFTAKVEPFTFNNKTIKSVSLGSYNRVKELKLAKGDMVNVKYEIIPYLLLDDYCEKHRSGNAPIPIITNCPYCNSSLVFNPELMCGNLDCESRMIGKIYNYCEKMGISDIGEATIETLYHAGLLRSIEDLYTLKDKKSLIIQLDGFGEKSYQKLIKSIGNVRRVEPATLMGSIGIPSIGKKIFSKILDIYNISELLKLVDDSKYLKLCEIVGVSNKTAKKIYEGVKVAYPLIKFLLQELDIEETSTKKSNLVVVFTGFRNAKFKEYLESIGVEVADTITGKTKLIIAENPNSGSSKLKKAIEKGIPVIDVFNAYERFKYNN